MYKNGYVIAITVLMLGSVLYGSDSGWQTKWPKMCATVWHHYRTLKPETIHAVRFELAELQKEKTQVEKRCMDKPSEVYELLGLHIQERFLKNEINAFVNSTTLRDMLDAKHVKL